MVILVFAIRLFRKGGSKVCLSYSYGNNSKEIEQKYTENVLDQMIQCIKSKYFVMDTINYDECIEFIKDNYFEIMTDFEETLKTFIFHYNQQYAKISDELNKKQCGVLTMEHITMKRQPKANRNNYKTPKYAAFWDKEEQLNDIYSNF